MFGGGGGGGLDPRKMQQVMEQMGIDMDEFDVESATLTLADGDRLVFDGPEVTKMEARGQSTYMVVGEPDRQESAGGEPALDDGDDGDDGAEDAPEIPEDDVELVATRTGAGAEDAREALEAEDGDLAAAIARLE